MFFRQAFGKKGAAIMKRLEETFDKSVHKITLTRAECVAAYRFLNNFKVSESILVNKMMVKSKEATKDKHVICLGDTSEWNLMNHKNRLKLDSDKIGVLSDNSTYGFMSHNILGIDRETSDILGWLNIELFNRPIDNVPYTRDNASVSIEEKESFKWLKTSQKAKEISLKECTHALFITDRESDIYEYLSTIPDEKTDILLRAKHDRNVINEQGKRVKVFDDIRQQEKLGECTFEIKDNKKRKTRKARLEIKSAKYKIQRPKKKWLRDKYPEEIEMAMVYAKEINAPQGEEPIAWYLWTTEQVDGLEDCIEKVNLYKLRWKVEEAHRLLKKEGFNLEDSELENPESIRKWLLMGMDTSLKVQQLKEARDGTTTVEVKEVFEEDEMKCLKHLNEVYEGATEKQKNPHPENSLAWASWIIARIGGWKGYTSQHKPGTITYKWGYEKFQTLMIGFRLNNPPS